MRTRGIYCGTCKQEKGPGCENDSRCKSCKSEYERVRRINKRLAAGKPETRPERDAYCEECKAKKAGGIGIGGRCNPCVTIANKIRLHAKRELEGKSPVGIRDSSFCHVCNIPKVDGRCMPCRRKAATERKAKRRTEAGKRPWGEGRPLTCYKCGEMKENPKNSHCSACASEYNKDYWANVLAPLVNQREVTMICECGKEKESTRKFYCDNCLLRRKRESTMLAARRRRAKLRDDGFIVVAEPLSEDEKLMRKAARDYLNSLIRQGYIQRNDCEVCGSKEKVEAHHDDYLRPLDVRWLCRIHHDEHHLNERLEKQNGFT